MGDTVLYERDGHVATITYNRPEALNAINADLRNDLNAAWVQFRDDEEAWVGIVTGAGRAFSAGADLRDRRPPQGGTFWEMPSANSLESGLEDLEAGHCRGQRVLPGVRANARRGL